MISINLHNVSKTFTDRSGQEVTVFDRFSLELAFRREGEVIALLGPSGSGKTTLLNLISGREKPSSGSIVVSRGSNAEGIRTGTLPQGYPCFPWLTALGNVRFGLDFKGLPVERQFQVANNYLSRVGLHDRAHAYPNELSGGMRQRVALARTLAIEPDLLLLDEPFSSLDTVTADEMQALIMNLWLEQPRSIFFVTHDVSEAVLMGSRILVLPPRPVNRVLDVVSVPFIYPRNLDLLTDATFLRIIQRIRKLLQSTTSTTAKEVPHE